MPVRFVIALLFFNMTGVHATRTLLTLYSIELGAGPFTIGLLATCFGVIPIMFSWTSGRLADRFGSRWLMLFGVAGSTCGVLLPYFWPGIGVFMIAGLLNGLTTTFCNVSLQTLVGRLSTSKDRARNYSNFSLAGSLTTLVGPLSVGFSIDLAGYASTCLLAVAIFVVPLCMLALRGSAFPPGSGQPPAEGGLRTLIAVPGVWRAMAVAGVGQTAGDLFHFYLPIYARAAGLSASTIGMLLAAQAAAQFSSRAFLPRLVARSNEVTVLAYAFGVAAAGFTLIPFCHTAVSIALASFLTGLGMGFSRPISMMLMYAHSPKDRSAEAMGLRLTAENMTRMVGPMLFGLVATGAGLAFVFWLNAMMIGSCGAYMHRSRRQRG